MADIDQIITLGIGTPSDIEHFILFGLNVGVIGVIDATLGARSFGSASLPDRQFGSADLRIRQFGTATVEDRP